MKFTGNIIWCKSLGFSSSSIFFPPKLKIFRPKITGFDSYDVFHCSSKTKQKNALLPFTNRTVDLMVVSSSPGFGGNLKSFAFGPTGGTTIYRKVECLATMLFESYVFSFAKRVVKFTTTKKIHKIALLPFTNRTVDLRVVSSSPGFGKLVFPLLSNLQKKSFELTGGTTGD